MTVRSVVDDKIDRTVSDFIVDDSGQGSAVEAMNAEGGLMTEVTLASRDSFVTEWNMRARTPCTRHEPQAPTRSTTRSVALTW